MTTVATTAASASRAPRGAWRARRDWAELAGATSHPDLFDPAELSTLPDAARRYVAHAIAPGTPLWQSVEVCMVGRIRLGDWWPFTARQVIAPGGYVWAADARVHHVPVLGYDRYSHEAGEMRWAALGLVPVVRATGPDVTRSAAGRLASEIALLPTAFGGASWEEAGPDLALATWGQGLEEQRVELRTESTGRLVEVFLQRWGNPDGGPFARCPFGVTLDEERTFGGITLPTLVRAGWWRRTDRQDEGEFFRARITSAVFRWSEREHAAQRRARTGPSRRRTVRAQGGEVQMGTAAQQRSSTGHVGERSVEPVTRLLDAVRAVGSDLELPAVLRHIVEAAVTLVQAQYGGLGVVDEQREGLSEFVTVGIDATTGAAIGAPPAGLGVLGELLRQPEPLRLADLASHPRSVGFPSHHPPMGTFVGVPLRVGDVVFGNLYLTNKLDGTEFTQGDEDVLVALAVAAGVAVRNARLYEQARRGSAWREAGRSISTSLLSGTQREDVLALLVRTSLGVVAADSVLIALDDGAGLHVAAASGALGPAQDDGLLDGLRQVLRQGQPLPAVSGDLSGFAVPLGPSGTACPGMLIALWASPPNPLLIDDLQGFAAQAAVALELADRRSAAERGAVLADRDRIGRDLHDLVIQRLFATGMRLQSALRLIPTDPAAATARVDLAVDDLDATIRELRSTIYGLQAPAGERPSLRARLLEVLDAATEHLGFAPVLRLDGLLDTAVSSECAEHVLATVRESLSNAARHAHASHAEVSVALVRDTLSVVVQDDGIGLTPGGSRSGLRNLVSRAAQLGGDLRLDRGHLGGTRVTWEVPVPGAAAAL